MKNILVPCDFSRPAINAFRFALQLASKSKATVHLLHAIELPVLINPIILTAMTFEGPYMEALKTDSANQFNKLKQDYLTETKDVEIVSSLNFGSTVKRYLIMSQEH